MISIPFANVADYVQKRFALEDVYRAATREIEEKLIGDDIAKNISVFSAPAFSAPIQRYFLSERLLESTSSLPIEDEQMKIVVKAGKRKGNVHYLELVGKDQELEPLLTLVQDVYHSISEEKTAWLRGERREVETAKILVGEKLPGLELVAMDAGPWSGWDSNFYFTFRSVDGFQPLAVYYRQFPQRTGAIKVQSPVGNISINSDRNHKSEEIISYQLKGEFQTDNFQWMINLAGYLDKYVGMGRKEKL